MITNKIYNSKSKLINVIAKGKQKTFLLKRGADKEIKQDYNGYGYSNIVRVYNLSLAEVRKFNKLAKGYTPTKPKTQEQIIDSWSRRLSKLAKISFELAKQIANEKLKYKCDGIKELETRQKNCYSKKREKLITNLERANPLRRIEDERHAKRIIQASNRHNNTDYEYWLEIAKEKAKLGIIPHSDIQSFARLKFKKY